MASEIVNFYKDSNVLITGGTGFFGKVLTQKLLRTCHNIQGIYLIIRMKNGTTANQRYQEIFQDTLFETLKREQPDFRKKIHLLEGDITFPNLGLSDSSVNVLTEKINVVFHCAATLNFRSDLKTAVETNVRSLRDLVQLSHKISNLKSFIYVSTAYSNCTQKLIEERFYDPPIQAATLIKLVEEVNETTLESITEGLLQSWPNTYCYTKAISENLLLQESKNLPVAVFRPSIVTSTHTEPISGWTSNVYGPLGLFYATGTGILRVINFGMEVTLDFVPVDMAVNALICSAWDTNRITNTQPYSKQITIYNYSAGVENNITLDDMKNILRRHMYLFKKKAWYPFIISIKSVLLFQICWFFIQTIPAHLMDIGFRMRGEKLSMVRINEKIKVISNVLNRFMSQQFDIRHNNVYSMWNRLKQNDKKLFPFDVNTVDKDKYLDDIALGLKLYVAKEPMVDREECKKKLRELKIIHYSVVIIVLLLGIFMFYKIVSLFLPF